MCLENVSTLLNFSKPRGSDVKFSEIVNMKFDGKNNYLHLMASEISEENFEKISEMMKVLVQYGCSPSVKNDKNQTTIDLIKLSVIDSQKKKKLLKIIGENDNINLFATSKNGAKIDISEQVCVFDSMLQNLCDENEEDFLIT